MQSIKDILFELLLEELTAQEWERRRLGISAKKQPEQEKPVDEGERKSA